MVEDMKCVRLGVPCDVFAAPQAVVEEDEELCFV
jgi:hypothetical protein